MRIIERIVCSLCLIACVVACSDDPLVEKENDDSSLSTQNTLLCGIEEEIDILPAQSHAQRWEIIQGDFLLHLGQGHFYVEQNDGHESRKAVVRVVCEDGSSQEVTLLQQVATKAGGATQNFMRHHGIGYSYNGVNGNYCDISDLRCQVLNRTVMNLIRDQEHITILRENPLNTISYKSDVYTSVVDYIHHTNFSASAEGGILLFSGSISSTCSAFEEGEIETHILSNSYLIPRIEAQVSVRNLSYYLDKYPQVLTSSFRQAVKELAATQADDWKAVDDFLAIYGTHVVDYALLGGRLTVDVQVETHKFDLIEKEYALAEADIATIFKKHGTTEEDAHNYEILRDSRCRVEVLGGDVSILDELIGSVSFGNNSLTEADLNRWMNSVTYDVNDLASSNAELMDMRVSPIWYLIPDEDVAKRVKARVMGNATLMMELLGNRNFINASFQAAPSEVECLIGTEKQKFTQPDVVDVIAANRHIATICHEWVPELSKQEKVYVAYPIYEGRVKLSNGLCLYKGKAYQIDWRYNSYHITDLGECSDSQTIYMTMGTLLPQQFSNINYQQGHYILGSERAGGLTVIGKLGGELHKVSKHFGHFYLDTKQRFNNIPGWEYTDKNPSEMDTYPEFIPKNEYANRMVRSDNYIYVFNTTEINYIN